jgi:Protein of unknown function (DUF2442)
MDYHVLEARHIAGYTVWLRFRDGTSGEVDLTPVLESEALKGLRDPERFRRFAVDPQFRTLVWPGGEDVAPEYLHDNIRVTT